MTAAARDAKLIEPTREQVTAMVKLWRDTWPANVEISPRSLMRELYRVAMTAAPAPVASAAPATDTEALCARLIADADQITCYASTKSEYPANVSAALEREAASALRTLAADRDKCWVEWHRWQTRAEAAEASAEEDK